MSQSPDYQLPYYKPKNPIIKNLILFLALAQGITTIFFVVVWALILSPIRLFSIKLYQKLESLAWLHGSKLALLVSNFTGGIPFYVYGDYGPSGGVNYGRNFIISNHVSSADWMYHLVMAGRNDSGYLRFFLKSMHKYVPILGWACILHECVFLQRDLEADKEYMKERLKSYVDNDSENYLVLYPEGTFTTPENVWQLEKSHEWSDKIKRKKLNNVLVPRTTGFDLILATNRNAFDYVVDVTIAFEKPYLVGVTKSQPPLMIDFVKHNEEAPVKIHMYYKRYAMSEIPKDTTNWLYDRFEEKEELLEHFKEHQRFPGHGYLIRDSLWDLIMNWLFGLTLECIAGYYVWSYFPKTFYSIAGFCAFTVVFMLWYDNEHQKKKVRPSKVKQN